MKNENGRMAWCERLKDEVRFFREMIKHTASENAVSFLCETRKHLTAAVAETYDPTSPDSVIRWATLLKQQVEEAGNDLIRATHRAEKEVPNTEDAYRRAVNLVAEIGGKIRQFEESITERV
ncbi:MAG: hypothetical protein EOM73_15860 [Bacteroidia bacterium]|nr:hypothetical protein [Bacteroidia bacterium]